jgi:pyrimidine-specific ribonucleoside hydrolase
VIIDCDPGHDDALALIMALASDKLDVRAVTVTGGNQTLAKTLNNAKRILSYIGKRPLLARGADKPMFRELTIAPQVHGDSGLDGPVIPQADYPVEPLPAVDLMRRIIAESPAPVTLLATGPLTNLGILLTAYPEVRSQVGRISLMGGGLGGGNWTSAAEFNILVDPEAAAIVFSSGLPITMCPVDVTHKAMIMRSEVEALRAQGGRVSVFAAELIDFFFKFHTAQGFPGAPLHDPCAAAWLIAPELFTVQDLSVTVETRGEHTTGMTLADRRPWSGAKPNVSVCLDVKREELIRLLARCCAAYGD